MRQFDNLNEKSLRAIAETIGQHVRADTTIELVGDVGAGKTAFVKGMAVGLGIDETIQSPTFTISRLYDAPNGLRLAHYDFYRLSEPGIMRMELAEAAQDADTVVVVEWAGVVEGVLPSERLRVSIAATSDDERTLTLEPIGEAAIALVGNVS